MRIHADPDPKHCGKRCWEFYLLDSISVVDLNTLNLDPDPGFGSNLDPDPYPGPDPGLY